MQNKIAMIIDVEIQNTLQSTQIPARNLIENWIKTALTMAEYSQPQVELTVRVVNKQESQSLNFQYRNKNNPTNILSFPFEAPPQIPCNLLGDLVICLDVVMAEAEEQKKLPENHWAHLIIHGTLHLLGYDHIDSEEAEVMEAIEIAALKSLGIANPY
ncbi:rRNA maturation RNase YbeY [Aliikangiella maris]|uniref:Endoribonuclease YbeY n=2 Tax=Aliikangiella maris TaxID=3162458 RepID=A0ABV3MM40_9GAMM